MERAFFFFPRSSLVDCSGSDCALMWQGAFLIMCGGQDYTARLRNTRASASPSARERQDETEPYGGNGKGKEGRS